MSWTQTLTTMTSTTSWEDLRKRARQLENEIDGKLMSLNKLGVSLGGQFTRFDVNYSGGSSEKSPLLSAQSTFETSSSDIAQSLNRLTDLNEQMNAFIQQSGATSNSGISSSAALLHTFQRHRDILSDYSNEFQKTRNNIQSRLDRENLLGAPSQEAESFSGGLNNRRSDAYLKEHEHIRNSDRMIDEQIGIAIATKDHMMSQKKNLRDITKKITSMTTERYPALNSLMQRISLKKRKDSLVVAGVVSVCLFLMFLYMWN